ncbi:MULTISPECIES: SpoIVB peptidase [unclassified Ruminococcus]|uniref:SpoIVB peptidase n=1 Tax=unclassified Ruminococcus TaxID=2608920 RepID=UPI00210AECC4|nr:MULTISPECIES: SpoIVB peptidase [unclassified Ruminococcus]
MRAKKIFKFCYTVTALSALALFGCTAFFASSIPDSFTVTDESTVQGLSAMPALTIVKDEKVNANGEGGNGQLVFANIFPVKSVSITSREDIKVIPGGTPFGVEIFTSGVMVVKTEELASNGRKSSPAVDAGIKVGDTIKSVNGDVVLNNSQLSKLVNKSNGKPLVFEVSRDMQDFTTSVTPIKMGENNYKIGLWIRDSSAGIGTTTFYCNENGGFAGLGHGICDVDTGGLMPLDHGMILNASIDTITKGIEGTPGSLNGHFELGAVGKLNDNMETGVYGTVNKMPDNLENEVSVASIQEVKTGKATLLTTLNGDEPGEYDIEIESIGYDENNKTKNMVIRITDEELKSKTGGIVQGMSGSPIIQNGKLAGAVTHVFVNAPDKGYAIFAENMLSDYARSTGLYDEAA